MEEKRQMLQPEEKFGFELYELIELIIYLFLLYYIAYKVLGCILKNKHKQKLDFIYLKIKPQ